MTDAFDKDIAVKMPKIRPKQRPKRPWDIRPQKEVPEPSQTVDIETIVNKTTVKETMVKKVMPEEQVREAENTKDLFDDTRFSFISDILLPSLRPEEQVVLLRLYRLSYSLRRETTDFVGYTRLAEQCNISIKTTYRAIKRLIENKYVTVIAHENRKGTQYKLNLSTIAPETMVNETIVKQAGIPSKENNLTRGSK